jgi:prolipoprotein diacylglyceryltransferase
MFIILGFATLTHTPLLAIMDAVALGMPLSQAFGRLGCLNYGCCHGRECSSANQFGIRYFDPQTKVLRFAPGLKGKRLHPTQLYSSMANLGIYLLILGLAISWDTRPPGSLVALYMTLYGFKRFNMEFLRGEYPRVYFSGLTVWQWFSLSFMALGILTLTVALFAGDMMGMANVAEGFQRMKSAYGILIIMSVIPVIAYGIHGKKIGSW